MRGRCARDAIGQSASGTFNLLLIAWRDGTHSCRAFSRRNVDTWAHRSVCRSRIFHLACFCDRICHVKWFISLFNARIEHLLISSTTTGRIYSNRLSRMQAKQRRLTYSLWRKWSCNIINFEEIVSDREFFDVDIPIFTQSDVDLHTPESH